jgi:hypothetical protein
MANEQPRRDAFERVVRQVANSVHAERRNKYSADGVCLNGRAHGPATDGRLCRRCRLVHVYGRAEGYRLYAEEVASRLLGRDDATASDAR